MPYVTPKDRERLDFEFSVISGTLLAETPGELNYLFTQISKRYIDHKGLSYQTINDIIGALEGCKLEFIRRVVNDYEQSKILSNGDVYK